MIDWRALKRVNEHKGYGGETADNNQARRHPPKNLAREDAQVEKQDREFGDWHDARIKYLREVKLLSKCMSLTRLRITWCETNVEKHNYIVQGNSPHVLS